MAGKSKQAKVKRDRRAVDMAAASDEPVPDEWRPPAEECLPADEYTLTPDGADPASDRVKLRLVNRATTGELVEFAMVQQTKHKGKWRNVAKADTAHDDETHLHRYGKRSGELGRRPEVLTPISSLDHVQDGYNEAYDRVFGGWSKNKQKWNDG